MVFMDTLGELRDSEFRNLGIEGILLILIPNGLVKSRSLQDWEQRP
jgi:hypothetical protein